MFYSCSDDWWILHGNTGGKFDRSTLLSQSVTWAGEVRWLHKDGINIINFKQKFCELKKYWKKANLNSMYCFRQIAKATWNWPGVRKMYKESKCPVVAFLDSGWLQSSLVLSTPLCISVYFHGEYSLPHLMFNKQNKTYSSTKSSSVSFQSPLP